MALSDNKRLYDIATRLQVYTEGVKVQYAREFNFVLAEVRETLRKTLGRVKYKTLDGLTKAELNRLIFTLRESQSKIYSNYTTQIISQLKEFMAVDLEVNRRIWATSFFELDDDEDYKIISDEEALKFLTQEAPKDSTPLFGIASVTGDDSRLWSTVTNTPIPANGLYLLPFLKTFANSAQAGVENIIRKAWANRLSVDETLNELIGTGETLQGTSSQLHRIETQAQAVVHTSFAHVGAIVAAGITSAVYGRYGWFSVMDSKTTEVCKSRNRRIYRFGYGPLPPAHIRCRSHIAPVATAADFVDETLYAWLLRQPDAVQDDIIGEEDATVLRNQTTRASDVSRFRVNEPLTFAQFRARIRHILSR